MMSSDTISVLERGDRKFVIVGTAHVSEASVTEVQALIRELKPDTVCIELCKPRYDALVGNAAWRNLDLFKVIREGKTLFLLAQLAIGAYQRRLGEKLGVRPGAELLAAAQTAEEVGARIELVDREVHITLKRTWANVGFWKKMELLSEILESLFTRQKVTAEDIERLKQTAHLSEMLSEFSRALPEVKVPLIDERDQYLMSKVEEAPGKTVVAVVGAAHVPGMKANFGKPVDRVLLDRLPVPSPWMALVKWVLPTLILLAFVWGWARSETTTIEQLLLAWVLPTSVMATLFTAVGGARPLSIVTAFAMAPLTTLNPLLGLGMVVGPLEAWLRKPTVADCERINEDIQSLRGIYRNPVTRVLLVTVLSTIGAALGAWIGISWLVAILT